MVRRVTSDETGIRTFIVPGLSSSPLSSAVEYQSLIFASGHVGRDAASKTVPADFADQARQALANLAETLKAAGGSMDSVLKTTVFLVRRSDFAEMNEIYSAAFSSPPPARSTLVVGLASEDLLFEIEALAVRGLRS